MAGRNSRQAPPPPPHAPLPEDFKDLTDRASNYGSSRAPQHNLLEARKKELQEELDNDLKQLDSERKEGLYRLDWELAEAIEALHARHAERANEKIRQHKEYLAEMEKRAEAGEHLTPDTIQRMRTPVMQQPVVSARANSEAYDEESPSESEEESEEENIFTRVIDFFSGETRESSSARRPRRQAPASARALSQEPLSPTAYSRTAPPPSGFTPESSPLKPMFLPEGAPSTPDLSNPFAMNTPSSPLATTNGLGGGFSPTLGVPELPFATELANPLFSSSNSFSPAFMPNMALEPPMSAVSTDWSPASVGVSPELSFGHFGQPGGFATGSAMNAWPPANVFHTGNGYA